MGHTDAKVTEHYQADHEGGGEDVQHQRAGADLQL